MPLAQGTRLGPYELSTFTTINKSGLAPFAFSVALYSDVVRVMSQCAGVAGFEDIETNPADWSISTSR